MRVQDPFGRARASGRENDRGGVIGGHGGQLDAMVRPGAKLTQGYAAPEQAPADRHVESPFGKPPRDEHSHGMRKRHGDEPLRLGLGKAADQVPPTHARVDEDHDRPHLEHRKDQRDEIDARPHQQGQSRARPDPQAAKPRGDPVAILIQLAKRYLAIVLDHRVLIS